MKEHPNILKTGTTSITLILKNENKIVVATDTQSSLQSGQFFNCGPKYKVINKKMVIAGAGAAADLQYLQKQIPVAIKHYERTFGIESAAVDVGKSILCNYLYERYLKGIPCYIGAQLAGFTNENKAIGYTFDMAGCATEIEDFDCVGSGGRYSTSILESGYKEDLTEQQAVELVKNAITVSKKYDLFTGLNTKICVLSINEIKTIDV